MTIRPAELNDLPYIVQLLANDALGAQRERYEQPLPNSYHEAFVRIQKDTNQELTVLENKDQKIIGTLQLSFIPYLTYRGGTRAQIEAVRIHEDHRGTGIGQLLFEWAIARAKTKGAHVVQLTTDKKRPKALLFYQKLGFAASHEGMKLHL
ncbi:GNAT family N-acetyltransferase [Maribacter sp. 2-571]|uniref:GNAT family N-acetyltransferase n=1 Tax=Maribacter sp. 2-571 TaxID=3417569 RepID=UPI003D3382C3